MTEPVVHHQATVPPQVLTEVGVPLAAQSYDDAIRWMLAVSGGDSTARVNFCTVHSVVESTRDRDLREAFVSADLDCMDGVPLVWVARLRGFREAERVCGPDVMLTLCDRGRSLGLRHFFLGGRPGTAIALAARLQSRFPGLEVVGTDAPPFRALTQLEDAALVARINESKADILWVGLGAPKQELWAAQHQDQLAARLLLPVGAAFDYHAGQLRRAPRFLQRVGLEWAFRLAMEPRRLFGRYLRTNALFVFLVLREELRTRR